MINMKVELGLGAHMKHLDTTTPHQEGITNPQRGTETTLEGAETKQKNRDKYLN